MDALPQPQIDPSSFIADTARVFGKVTVGQEVSVWFGVVIRAELAPVTVGALSNIQDNVVIHTDTGYPVRIGVNVTVGHSAVVHGATINDGALVGMGAILLNGSTVESGALVAAGTVVPPGARVPTGMLAVGNPMRIPRSLRDSEVKSARDGVAHYRDLAILYRNLASS